MREIIFRAKTLRAGKRSKWIYGSMDCNKYTYKECRIVSKDDPVQYWYTVDRQTVGQYTGLKDKKGVEIYEGDILKYAGGGIYIVVYGEMMIMCPQDNIEMPSPGYYGILIGDGTKELCPLGVTQRLAKIIGNIYDNPELLKAGD